MSLVELIPNFSAARDPHVVSAIRDAMAAVDGAVILDVSSDLSHNRTVITLVAKKERAVDVAFAGIRKAAELIDLTQHTGEHPRIGATDVMPFVPLPGTTMDECVALAKQLGARVGKELAIPVYLYSRAATRPDRVKLPDVRKGQFEGLRDEIGTNPDRAPDFGPAQVHARAGATAIGARPILVAYNVYIGPSMNLPIAKEIAKAVRESSGGLKAVQAMGLDVDGQAQVSMNLIDTDVTPLHVAFDAVKKEAAARGVETTWSEIVGLVPERMLFDAGMHHVQLRNFSPAMTIEHKVNAALTAGPSLAEFVASVASSKPVPGGGSVVAHAGALGAALAQMVAGLTIGKKKYVAVEPAMKEIQAKAAALCATLSELVVRDADAYSKVTTAYKMPQTTEAEKDARDAAIEQALTDAADVPLETARLCADVAELAVVVAEDGNSNAVSDAGVAALLAEAAAKGAAYNVRINVVSLKNRETARVLEVEAKAAVARASELAATTVAIVEKALV